MVGSGSNIFVKSYRSRIFFVILNFAFIQIYLELVVIDLAALVAGRLVGGRGLLVAHVHLLVVLLLDLLALGRLRRLLKAKPQMRQHSLLFQLATENM